MDIRFHLSHRFYRSVKCSKHNLSVAIDTIQKVLILQPDRGVPIPGHSKLRKVRVGVPGIGKSGGYRLIYRQALIEETIYISLLEIFFKSESADLSKKEYDTLLSESNNILENHLRFDWI